MKYILELRQTTSFSSRTKQHALSSHQTKQNTEHNLNYLKILELTLDPKLTYNKHIEITTTNSRKPIQILKEHAFSMKLGVIFCPIYRNAYTLLAALSVLVYGSITYINTQI